MRKQSDGELQSEAKSFADLTKKLLAVPKKEIDNEKARYEKERTKEKRGK